MNCRRTIFITLAAATWLVALVIGTIGCALLAWGGGNHQLDIYDRVGGVLAIIASGLAIAGFGWMIGADA